MGGHWEYSTSRETEPMFQPPITYDGDKIRGLYRLADTLDQVNWSAQMASNLNYAEEILPKVCEFLDTNIRKVAYNSDDLKVIVGISGIDSGVCAYLAAETMRRAKKSKSVREVSLTLVNFKSMSEDDVRDGKDYYRDLASAYKDISVHFCEVDLTPRLRDFDSLTDEVLKATHHPQVWPAEPSTGLIDLATVNMGYKIGAASLDSTNRTEGVIGELNIPSGCSIHILERFWKTQVYDLAYVLKMSYYLRHRKPVNSTYGVSKVDAYFGEIPRNFTPRQVYKVLDQVLKRIYEDHWSPELVSKDLGHSREFAERVRNKIYSQEHRRHIPVFLP